MPRQHRLPAFGSLPVAIVGSGQRRADDDDGWLLGHRLSGKIAAQIMHVDTQDLYPDISPDPWRTTDASRLASALREVRNRTLQVFDAYMRAGMLKVPQTSELNPPLWELGHIGWFQELWTSRNPARDTGARCDPDFVRLPSLMAQSDSLYDSSAVAHDRRWSLPLPTTDATKDYLVATLEKTLGLLETSSPSLDAVLLSLRI